MRAAGAAAWPRPASRARTCWLSRRPRVSPGLSSGGAEVLLLLRRSPGLPLGRHCCCGRRPGHDGLPPPLRDAPGSRQHRRSPAGVATAQPTVRTASTPRQGRRRLVGEEAAVGMMGGLCGGLVPSVSSFDRSIDGWMDWSDSRVGKGGSPARASPIDRFGAASGRSCCLCCGPFGCGRPHHTSTRRPPPHRRRRRPRPRERTRKTTDGKRGRRGRASPALCVCF